MAFLLGSTLWLALALSESWTVAFEMTTFFAVAALRAKQGRTDYLTVRSGTVLDKVAGVALLVFAVVKAYLTEGLLCLARLLRAGSTTTPLGANLSSRLAGGTRLRAALAGLVNDDGEGKGRHDVL